jgi:parallel beta-helix repeat protein
MNSSTRRLLATFSLGLGLALALVWVLGGGMLDVAQAQSGTGIIRVATTGSDAPGCGSVLAPCRTVQYAVDTALDGEEVHVATGIYTGVQGRPAPPGYFNPPTSNIITQVVYITKTVTVRGGYKADFSAWNPDLYSTTLDAEGKGRVFAIFGAINPTIEWLNITGGNAAGLGGDPGRDAAGGIGIIFATATIRNCRIYNNTAEVAGGVGMGLSGAILSENIIEANTASEGGGVGLSYSPVTLIGNTIISNTSSGDGGGIVTTGSDGVTLIGNTIISNTSLYAGGGGLYMDTTTATLSGDTFVANTSRDPGGGEGGGAVYLWDSNATFVGAAIISNTTASYGGGVFLSGFDGSDATLINSVIADNRADVAGSGLYIERLSSYRLLHVTIAHNTGGDDSGIHVTTDESNKYSTVIMTNTILVGHAVGITVAEHCTATLESTLWSNIPDWGGDGDVTTNNDYTGDPAFVDPAAWDYHLTGKSAAIDEGIDTFVLVDKDGVVRPQLRAPDLGAYEYAPPPVGGHTEPVKPLVLLWPWLWLAIAVATGAIAALLKRRPA